LVEVNQRIENRPADLPLMTSYRATEDPMKSFSRKKAAMSNDAYAGFLKLLLTPAGREPIGSSDVNAYIEYLNDREPLSKETRRIIGHANEQAA
jgi:hypothetical protein